MRLLFVVHQFLPDFAGGTEQVTLNLALAAQADGHRVEVLTVTTGSRPGWRKADDGLLTTVVQGVPVAAIAADAAPIVELGFKENPAVAAGVARFLANRPRFDVAHVTHVFRAAEIVEALAERGVPYVVSLTDFNSLCYRFNLVRLNGDLCGGPDGGAACRTFCPQAELDDGDYAARTDRYGRILRRASAVVAVSPYVAERVRAEHPDLPLHIVPNGVDLLKYGPRPKRPTGPVTFGFLGTVSEAKGALLLAEAFANARAKARLKIVGPCYDTAVAARLAELSERADIALEHAVPRADVPALLQGFDVLCIPGLIPEAFSLVLHEGFAAGLPALVSNIGNAAAVVAESGAGWTVTAGDADAWTQAIADLADRPDEIAARAKAAPLPWRVEEETFLYNQLYRQALSRPR